jgi:RNA polymerase sigma-70 factor, ECF subfamily
METVADYIMEPAVFARLRAGAMRFAHTPDAAEEALQDTIAAAMKRAGSSAANVGRLMNTSYLMTMLHSRAISNWRSEHRTRGENSASFVPFAEEDSITYDAVSEKPIDKQATDRLLATEVLERLTASHREVLELVVMQQLSVAEAAEYIGTQEGTVKSRLHYARRAARGILRGLGVTGQQDL